MTNTETPSAVKWRLDLDDYVSVLQVSPDRRQAVVGSLGGDAALLDVNDGTAVDLVHHEMGVLSAAWSGDGNRVAVGGQDGQVRIYDRDGVERGVIATAAWVQSMAWSREATVLAVGTGRHLYITDHDGVVLHDFDDHPSSVTAVAWAPDGSRVGATAYGGIAWYDIVGKRSGRQRRFDWKGSLLALALSPDGKWACAGAQDATVHLWKLWSGRELSMGGYPAKIERLAFREDGRWLAVACVGEVTVWDFSGNGPAGTTPATASGHEKHIEALAWNPSGDLLATGGGDSRTVIWGAPRKRGEDMSSVSAFESDAATSRLGWLSDTALLVGRSDGGIVRLEV